MRRSSSNAALSSSSSSSAATRRGAKGVRPDASFYRKLWVTTALVGAVMSVVSPAYADPIFVRADGTEHGDNGGIATYNHPLGVAADGLFVTARGANGEEDEGQAGGTGGEVDLTIEGLSFTDQPLTVGVFASADGGRGGEGGEDAAGFLGVDQGGRGGDGGYVRVELTESGAVETDAPATIGVFASASGGARRRRWWVYHRCDRCRGRWRQRRPRWLCAGRQ